METMWHVEDRPMKSTSQTTPCGALSHGDVHVLHGSLAGEVYQLREWYATLSHDERQRAGQFHFDLHRDRFIAARGILRMLLGRYLDTLPNSIVFNYGLKGKPSLPSDPLHFNVSHSEGRALFAFSATTALGVDLEAVRPLPDVLQIARSAFSTSERKALEALAPELQHQAFFRCWTRKEAFIKALGDGLSFPLDRFSVSLDEPARIIHVDGELAAPSQWTLQHLALHDGFVGAIATRQQHPRVLLSHWKEIVAL